MPGGPIGAQAHPRPVATVHRRSLDYLTEAGVCSPADWVAWVLSNRVGALPAELPLRLALSQRCRDGREITSGRGKVST